MHHKTNQISVERPSAPWGPSRSDTGGTGSCCSWKDTVISAKDFELYPDVLEELVKDFSQGHDYRIRLHFRAVTPTPVWWMGEENTEPDCRSMPR